jgi:hypothetical protein
MDIKRFNPAVDKKILVLIAGLMWCGVGIMLVAFAVSWLNKFGGTQTQNKIVSVGITI